MENREFYSDKLTIVDVKAKDEKGTTYQIEIQLAVFSYLPERILYTWSDIYQSQLQSGVPFSELRPVISIWMLTENLIPESPAFHHHFQLVNQENQKRLSEHCSIHVLKLEKWRYSETLTTILKKSLKKKEYPSTNLSLRQFLRKSQPS